MRLQAFIDGLTAINVVAESLVGYADGVPVADIAAELFFSIASQYTAFVRAYPPAEKILQSSLWQLGTDFISPHALQIPPLLELLLERPDLEIFCILFKPDSNPRFVELFNTALVSVLHLSPASTPLSTTGTLTPLSQVL